MLNITFAPWQQCKKCERPNLNFYGSKRSSGVVASACNLNHVLSGGSQCYFVEQVGDPNAFLHYWVLRVAFSGATACVAHIDGSDLYGE